MIPGAVPAAAVPPVIERDRMYMAQRPGMLHKHLPVVPDAQGNYLTGGRYLFKTHLEALDYERWTHHDFVLDGEIFVQRSLFVGPECRAWKTIGAFQVGDLATNTPVLRTERYSVPDWDMTLVLKLLYPVLRHRALEQGLTGMWLLYDDRSDLVTLVYFADRVGDYTPGPVPDLASLGALAQKPRQGRLFELLGWPNVFDRTQFTFTIWFPYEKGDQGRPSVWPNSPALPEPYAGDSVCQPSRGETYLTAPTDCSAQCGNGELDAGENNQSCPSDVPAY
ncbi:MAG TPA: hypothetical protein VE153_19750 [Myxococcus sp.]|nr:hypothetical protein [Myxococcus sp.]